MLGELQSMAEITYGSYWQRSDQGTPNLPLGDRVAIRIAGNSTTMIRSGRTSSDRSPAWLAGHERLCGQGAAPHQADVALGHRRRRRLHAAARPRIGGANVIGLLNYRADVNNTPNDSSDDVPAPIDVNDRQSALPYLRGRYPEAEQKHWGTRLNVNYDAGPAQIESSRVIASSTGISTGSNADSSSTRTQRLIGMQQYDNWSFAGSRTMIPVCGAGTELRIVSPYDQRVAWSVGGFGFWEDQGASSARSWATRAASTSFKHALDGGLVRRGLRRCYLQGQ